MSNIAIFVSRYSIAWHWDTVVSIIICDCVNETDREREREYVCVIPGTQECLLCQHSLTVVFVSPAWSEADTAAFYQPDTACPFKKRKVNNGRTLRGG